METLVGVLLIVQFVVVVSHDWLEIPGWTHGRQVQAVVGRDKLLAATLINAIFPGVAAAFAIAFWKAPKPWYVTDYWVLYCAITVLSALAMWYVPYFFGTSERTRREYAAMYAGTVNWLPPRGDNPRPNALHIAFHVLFLANLALVLVLRFGS